MIVIRCWGVAGPAPDWFDEFGKFLATNDFEANHGRGHTTWTNDLAKAMKFANTSEATRYWRTQSKTVPLRPDGRPNRPLTAYHVSIEKFVASGPVVRHERA